MWYPTSGAEMRKGKLENAQQDCFLNLSEVGCLAPLNVRSREKGTTGHASESDETYAAGASLVASIWRR